MIVHVHVSLHLGSVNWCPDIRITHTRIICMHMYTCASTHFHSHTSNPGCTASRSQTANKTGQCGDEIMEATDLTEHGLLVRVQLKHPQHHLKDFTLHLHCSLGGAVQLVQEGIEVHRAIWRWGDGRRGKT